MIIIVLFHIAFWNFSFVGFVVSLLIHEKLTWEQWIKIITIPNRSDIDTDLGFLWTSFCFCVHKKTFLPSQPASLKKKITP